MYSNKVAQEFVPKVVDLIFDLFEYLSIDELHDIEPIFVKRIAPMISNFMRRYKTSKENEEVINAFNLKINNRMNWNGDDTEKSTYDRLLVNGYLRGIQRICEIYPYDDVCFKFYHRPGPYEGIYTGNRNKELVY